MCIRDRDTTDTAADKMMKVLEAEAAAGHKAQLSPKRYKPHRKIVILPGGKEAVSYTHLTAVCRWQADRRIRKNRWQPQSDCPRPQRVRHTIQPVSYTHLDVYKRQLMEGYGNDNPGANAHVR